MRQELQRDLITLRAEIQTLLDAREVRRTVELLEEIRALRTEVASLRAQLRGEPPSSPLDGPG